LAGAKILVVDDSPTELALTRTALQQAGYRILTAADGEQALQMVGREVPDLIVLDVVLPRKNGYQVCRQLKSSPDTMQTKILMLSNKSLDADKFWALRQGADLYMTKPFDVDELLGNVEQLLR
jgi:twitching motility two-component system response regulator PilH